MSDEVLITLIVAVLLLLVLWIYRKRLSRFDFKAGTDGVDTKLETRPPQHKSSKGGVPEEEPRLRVKRNWLFGWRNRIRAEGKGVSVEDNKLLGGEQDIDAGADRR